MSESVLQARGLSKKFGKGEGLVRAVDEVDRDTVLQWQRVLFAWTGKQPDAVEGVRAFLERRPPVWKLSKNKDLPRELLEPIMVQEEQHG